MRRSKEEVEEEEEEGGAKKKAEPSHRGEEKKKESQAIKKIRVAHKRTRYCCTESGGLRPRSSWSCGGFGHAAAESNEVAASCG